MSRGSPTVVVSALVLVLSVLAGEVAAQQLPDPSFYSPQPSPDGRHVLWESFSRGGSLWITDASGGEITFVIKGHSPSWAGNHHMRFVTGLDDGHRVLAESLQDIDLESQNIRTLGAGGNPDYHATLTSTWTGATLTGTGPLAGKVICVDPGHGHDSGAHSPITGKKEDFYVLIMSYLARDYLEAAGATVRMTRFDNSILPGLQERVNFSNACGAIAFNAVHLNFSENTSARGLELYYRTKEPVSQAQATKLADAMVAASGVPSRGVRADKDTLGYTLAVLSDNHINQNKSLSEACFLTNAEDVKLLENPRAMEQFAWGIYAGLSRTAGVEPAPITTASPEAFAETFARPGRTWIGAQLAPVAIDTPEGDHAAGALACDAGWIAARTGGACWADYRVSATVALTKGAGTYGLVARSNTCAREGDTLEGYLLVVDESARKASLLLSLGKPGEATTLATADLPAGQFQSGTKWHALALECRGTAIRGTVDGVALIAPRDGPASPPVLANGKAGLFVKGAATAAADRIALEPLGRD